MEPQEQRLTLYITPHAVTLYDPSSSDSPVIWGSLVHADPNDEDSWVIDMPASREGHRVMLQGFNLAQGLGMLLGRLGGYINSLDWQELTTL